MHVVQIYYMRWTDQNYVYRVRSACVRGSYCVIDIEFRLGLNKFNESFGASLISVHNAFFLDSLVALVDSSQLFSRCSLISVCVACSGVSSVKFNSSNQV